MSDFPRLADIAGLEIGFGLGHTLHDIKAESILTGVKAVLFRGKDRRFRSHSAVPSLCCLYRL